MAAGQRSAVDCQTRIAAPHQLWQVGRHHGLAQRELRRDTVPEDMCLRMSVQQQQRRARTANPCRDAGTSGVETS